MLSLDRDLICACIRCGQAGQGSSEVDKLCRLPLWIVEQGDLHRPGTVECVRPSFPPSEAARARALQALPAPSPIRRAWGIAGERCVCHAAGGDLADAGHAHGHCSAVLLVCPSALRLLRGRGRDSHLLRRTPTAHSSVRCALCPGQLHCTAVVELPATGCISPMSISPQGWTSLLKPPSSSFTTLRVPRLG
jgi:hypothetical protein